MAKANYRSDSDFAGSSEFVATRWSIVVAACRRSSPHSLQALESLCQTYWYPLYAYVRRRVPDIHQAQDLTQEFFATLLERNAINAADQNRGRFRSFLLTAIKNFLADEWDKAKAQKRGGGRRAISLDLELGERRYSRHPSVNLSPDCLYEKQWALTLLDRVLGRLSDEFVAKDQVKQFETLKPFLIGQDESGGYKNAASELGVSETAARVAAYRMRRRYRELLRAEIAETVATAEEVDDELGNLWAVLS